MFISHFLASAALLVFVRSSAGQQPEASYRELLVAIGETANATEATRLVARIDAETNGSFDANWRDVEDDVVCQWPIRNGTLLHRVAACLGSADDRLQIVRLLLDRRADPNAKYEDGLTALMSAAAGGLLEVARLLVDRGADPNAKTNGGTTALSLAVANNQHAVENFLRGLASRSSAANSLDGSYRELLEVIGVKTNATEARRLIDEIDAATNGSFDANWRAAEGDVRCMAVIENGTLLHRVATCLGPVNDRLQIAGLLLDRGADVNATTNSGSTALIFAASFGDLELVRLLLDRGADANAKNNKSGTALLYAAANGEVEMAKLLVERGADVTATTTDGMTALSLALDGEHSELADYLRGRVGG